MNHIYTTTKATILFVEVPEDIYGAEVVNGNLKHFIEGSPFAITQKLPNATWQFITLLKDAREDVAMTLVDSISPYENRVCYRDYEGSPDEWLDRSDYFDTAIESLHSLATSLGVKGNAAVLVKVSV